LTLMAITCGDCGARFRLDVALMKDAIGIRVRCRRWGGKIVVLRPESPSGISANDVVAPLSSVPALDLQEAVAGEDTELPQPVPKPDADLPSASEVADPAKEISPPPSRSVRFSPAADRTC
jgi:hypothetical protein